MKPLLEENLKRLQTHPVIDREIALRSVNWPLYYQWKGRQSCIRKAASTPLPGSLLGAFFDKSILVEDKEVCRIVPAHFFILQKLNSPLLELLSDASESGKSEKEFSEQAKWDICWLFTHSPEAMFKLVESGGAEALATQAKEIALTWKPELVECVILAVIEQIKRHAETKARLINDMATQKKISFFPAPKEPQK